MQLLDAACNLLDDLPRSLGALPSLAHLEVDGNPLLSCPPALAALRGQPEAMAQRLKDIRDGASRRASSTLSAHPSGRNTPAVSDKAFQQQGHCEGAAREGPTGELDPLGTPRGHPQRQVLMLVRDGPSVSTDHADEVFTLAGDMEETEAGQDIGEPEGHALRSVPESDLLPPASMCAMESRMTPLRPVTDDGLAEGSGGEREGKPGSAGGGGRDAGRARAVRTAGGGGAGLRPDSAAGRMRPSTQAQVRGAGSSMSWDHAAAKCA